MEAAQTESAPLEKRPLMGTHFILDEEKILREGKYDLEKMYEKIDEFAQKSGMIKIDKNTYHCKGDNKDLACIGIFVYDRLMESEWFTKNVKEWTWISEKEGNETLMGDDLGVWE